MAVMARLSILSSLIAFLWLLLPVPSLWAQKAQAPPAEEKPPIFVEADSLEYFKEERIIVGSGNVEARFEGRTLSARRVKVDLAREVLWAEGDVVLIDGLNQLQGEQLEYHYRAHVGTMHRAKGFLAPATTFEGVEIHREGPKHYRLLDASVTTCRICRPTGPPDWELRAREVIVKQDDVVFGKGVSFWVKNIPIAYAPLIAFPLGPRRTGFLLPDVGYSGRSGFIYRQPFFWAISESQDATFTLGYRTKRGFEGDVEYRYILPKGHGQWEAKYFREEEAGRTRDNRWTITGRHDQLLRPGLSLKASVDIVSDRAVRRDFVEEPMQLRTARFAPSRVFLTQAWPSFTLQALGEWDRDLAPIRESRFIRAPELKFTAIPQELGPTPLLAQLETSATYFERDVGVDSGRLDLFPKLSLPWHPLPWITLTPSLGLRETAYTKRDDSGSGGATRELLELQGSLEARFFRGFELKNKPIEKLVHLIEPRVGYQYIPEVEQQDLPQFDPVDFVSFQSRITVMLNNRLMAYRREPSGTMKSWEALTFSVGQSYNLAAKERAFSDLFLTTLTPERLDQAVKEARPTGQDFSRAKERSFSNIVATLALSPIPLLTLRETFAFNPEENRGDAMNTSIKVTYPSIGFLELGHSYVRGQALKETIGGEPEAVKALTGRVGLGPFRGLSLEFATRFDGVRDKFLENQVAVKYVTCCWEVTLRYTNRADILGVRKEENDIRVMFDLRFGP